MKLNKMGIYVRKNIDSFLNTLFGRTTRLEQTEPKLHNGVKLGENVNLGNKVKKTLLEAEVKKTEAFELIRRFQNC
jgi:hypothetical protein